MTPVRLLLACLLTLSLPVADAVRLAVGSATPAAAALADSHDDDDDDGDSDDDDSDDDSGDSDDSGDDNGGSSGGDDSDDSSGDDSDDSSDGGADDGDDDGASGGSSSGSDDDDDSSGSGSGDDDDDRGGDSSGRGSGGDEADDDIDREDRAERPARRVRAPARRVVRVAPLAAPRLEMPRSEADRARSAEISAANVTEADLARLEQAGFRVIRQRPVAILGGTLALRLRTPRQFTPRVALQLARQAAPSAVFDFSHLYSPGQDGAEVYARDLVRISAAPGCGRSARVGQIDTAVARHDFLRGARITRRDFIEGPGDASHGTAVASLIVGADPSGRPALDGAQLFAANVFAAGNSASLDADAIDIVAALDWLAASGAKVVNISIAGPANAILEAATTAAARRGLILVAAAGNGAAGGRPRYPAAYPAVIAVSAVDRRGRPYESNTRGPQIDIAAPGVDVFAARASGGGALWSGTSFAAPFVTVELAIAASRGAISNVEDARRHLARNARDLGAPGDDPVFGLGLLQSGGC